MGPTSRCPSLSQAAPFRITRRAVKLLLVRREHSIPADLARLKEARDFADRAAAEFGFPADVRYQIKLAVCEAVTNAIQHGSRSADDPIRIFIGAEAGTLVFEVLDTGRFVPRVTRRGDRSPRAAAASSS